MKLVASNIIWKINNNEIKVTMGIFILNKYITAHLSFKTTLIFNFFIKHLYFFINIFFSQYFHLSFEVTEMSIYHILMVHAFKKPHL